MSKGGLVLYRNKVSKMFLVFRVLYEYPDTRFIGFDPNFAYRIKKTEDWLKTQFREFSWTNEKDGKTRHYKFEDLTVKQKDWLLKGGYKKILPSTSSVRIVGDYVIYPIEFDVPKGKLYTQIPGGGGVFKVTRAIQDTGELLRNDTVKKALEKWGSDILQENSLRKVIRKSLKESSAIAYTGAAVEEIGDIARIDSFVIIQGEDDEDEIKSVNPKDWENIITLPHGWEKSENYHITIKLGVLPLSHQRDVGKSVDNIKVIAIGMSENAVALEVEMPYLTKNDKAHITIAYNTKNGGTSKDSKEIETWHSLEHPFEISAMIREFPKQSIEEEDKTWFKSPSISVVPPGMGSSFPQAKNDEEEEEF